MRTLRIGLLRVAGLAAFLSAAALLAAPANASDLSDLFKSLTEETSDDSVDSAPPVSRKEAAEIWDAFLTAVVKRAGQDVAQEELRDELLALLLDERTEIVAALATATIDGPPWLAKEFESSWERIDPLLDRVAGQLPPATAKKYRRFLESGRLLEAAQSRGWLAGAANPSALRELARAIVPESAGDPLAYEIGVDPELRALFGFDAMPEVDASPLLGASQTASYYLGPLGLIARLADAAGYGVGTANAAASGWDWHTLVSRLNNWVPGGKREMREYLPMVREMLDGTAHTLAERSLPPEHFEIYRNLVVTTAWQESCWRQYEKRAGQVEPVRGPGPSLGLMQVNTRVWRGVYDSRGVASDIGYNGRAGAEILYHYMRKHALRAKEHLEPGGEQNLARATWAAYNGGPGHLRRYRKPQTSAHLRAVDTEFWQKYQAVDRDDESAFFACAVKG
jgi:soluble lytic murein transglycosylase-like protein